MNNPPSRMATPETIVELASRHFSKEEEDMLFAALQHAEYCTLQLRAGQELLDRSCSATTKLLTLHPDLPTTIASIVQHLPEEQQCSFLDKRSELGRKVRSLLNQLKLVESIRFSMLSQNMHEQQVMLLTIAEDVRAYLLTACNRWDDLSKAVLLPPQSAQLLSRTVLETYAPIAARFGIYQLKNTLESLAFPILHPTEASEIAAQISAVHHERVQFLAHCQRQLEEVCKQAGLITVVSGREKLPYSAFRKMRERNLSSVSALPDLFAFRIILNEVEDCYLALGAAHKHFRPLLHRFKDYISFPKPNGYRSLHTTVLDIDPQARHIPVEIQIRTHLMHQEADFGIAAHWDYKEGHIFSPKQRDRWQRQIQEIHRLMGSVEGDKEQARELDLLSDHIFVLTPRGDVIELPEGATPLDFAFRIHTDIGLTYRAARVNGVIVGIDHQLENGDVVEILTQKDANPSPQWISYVRTSDARLKIRQFFSAQQQNSLLSHGKRLLNEALMQKHLAPLDTELSVLRNIDGRKISMEERESILVKIAKGAERASSVLRRLGLSTKTRHAKPTTTAASRHALKRLRFAENIELPYRFAKCCDTEASMKAANPHPPKLVGFITRAGYITVHRQDCHTLQGANLERLIGVEQI
jgi:GTP pyrophosphokinase